MPYNECINDILLMNVYFFRANISLSPPGLLEIDEIPLYKEVFFHQVPYWQSAIRVNYLSDFRSHPLLKRNRLRAIQYGLEQHFI